MAMSHVGRRPNVPTVSSCSPEIEGGRIIVTKIGSLDREVIKGRTLLQRQEVPPPLRHETLNLSKEEDSLSEAPWRVYSVEEPLMEMR